MYALCQFSSPLKQVLFCWSGLSLVYTASSFFTCHLFAFASIMVTLSVNPIVSFDVGSFVIDVLKC